MGCEVGYFNALNTSITLLDRRIYIRYYRHAMMKVDSIASALNSTARDDWRPGVRGL